MSEQARRVLVSTIVSHTNCRTCERLASKVVEAVLKTRRTYPDKAFEVRTREESHYALAITPARVTRWVDTEEYGWRQDTDHEPDAALFDVYRDIEAAAQRLQEEAWEALAAEDYDGMRNLEARAQGLRQAARIVREERRKYEH